MNQRLFALVILALLITGALVFQYQRTALTQGQAALAARLNVSKANRAVGVSESSIADAPPSSDLLRLRGELAVARREWTDHLRSEAARAYSNDWQMVYSGPRPSEMPGFVNFTNLARHQFDTPDNALQSWHYAFHNQQTEPLNSTRMKEIWDVPDDFDQEPGYNIHMGEGLYGGVGFRVVAREVLATNLVRLVFDYEKEDGSSYRRERNLVQRNGRWRVQPASVTRIQPMTALPP